MTTPVLLTIDTELTRRHYRPGSDWRENHARSIEPAASGLAWQLEELARHGLRACFFVDPMPALLYGLEPIRRMIEPILAAGQEVQLHLHSFWYDLARGRETEARYELTAFDAAGQRELIDRARRLLVEAGAPNPIAFRSGSYAADATTLEGLAALGFTHDSSHNGAEHPWPSALPLDPTVTDPIRLGAVLELPIAQIRQGRGLRPFQICALSRWEMASALRHASTCRQPLVTIVSHSFELASRDGLRPNRLIKGRFSWLCAFLARHADRFTTCTIGSLPPLERGSGTPLLADHPLRRLERHAEQAFGDALYERPLLGRTLIAAPPAAALGLLIDAAL